MKFPLKIIFFAVLMNLSATGSSLLLMAASAWLITSASFHPPLSTLAVGITIVRAAGLFRAIFRYADRLTTHTAIFSMLTEIRLRLFKAAMKIFPLKSGATGESELLHELTINAEQLKDFFPRIVQPFLCAMILILIVTIYLFKVIGFTSIILIVSMISILIISYVFNSRQIVNDSNYREVLLDLNDGREEIFSYGSETIAINKLDVEANNLSQAEIINRNKIINVDSLCNLISAMTLIIILNSLIDRVDLIDLAVWLFILLSTLEMFNALPEVVKNLLNLKFQSSFINSEVKIKNTIQLPITHYKLQIKNLNFSYNSTAKVLENLNFEVKHGEKIAIVGESGSGKTTLLYLMLGLWQPDSGEIFINGTISAATTNNYIFSKSIRENFLIYAPNISEEKIFDLLKIVQLENFDLDEEIGENACKLSGGQRCRLQIALTLAVDAEILILDEPTSGLDKKTSQKLIDSILNDCTKKDRTLIIITHDLFIAKMMDKIYKLYDNKIIYAN